MNIDTDFNGYIAPYELYEYLHQLILFDDDFHFKSIMADLRKIKNKPVKAESKKAAKKSFKKFLQRNANKR